MAKAKGTTPAPAVRPSVWILLSRERFVGVFQSEAGAHASARALIQHATGLTEAECPQWAQGRLLYGRDGQSWAYDVTCLSVEP
jgi:hypothetical protein